MFAVVLYHGIDDGRGSDRAMDPIDREYVLDRRHFEQHVEYLATTRAAGVGVIVSFDDGDLSGYTLAAPILEQHGLRGEFFIVTGWIGRSGFMSAAQLRDLAARGHGIHSHSRTHRRLPDLTRQEIDDELRRSKDDLELLLGRPVELFSIPGGAFDDRVIETASCAGYSAVLSSIEGYNNGRDDSFVLRRFAARSYSTVSTLAAICEHPFYTSMRLAAKRTMLGAVRGGLGRSAYERLRGRVIASLPATSAPRRPHRE
jgi:peptidoglycan/xylan/chitin deacetylase (PgdA/CDA1 family)